MKFQKCFGKLLTAVALIATAITANAQQYQPAATFLVQGTTNAIATGGTTNVHITANGTNGVSLTKWDSFELTVDGYVAGALTNGFIDVVYAASANGTVWPTNDTFTSGPAAGWFSVPVNTGGSRIVWNTNVTVGSLGYWRINYLTNRTGLTVSNMTIQAYTKPRRNG